MGRDRLDRIGAREAAGKPAGMERGRVEKSQMVTIEKLRERRELREIEDLKGEVAILTKQLAQEKEKLEEKEKKLLKDSDRKAVEKEMANLEKQIKRAQDEIESLTESRDSFKKQVNDLHRDLDSDSRLISLREELKTSKELANKHSIQLKAIEEESKVYKERCEVLQMVQDSQEGEKDQMKFVAREKKRLEQEVEKLKEEVKENETTKKDLVDSLQDARKKIEALEKQIVSLEKENARLDVEKEELEKKSTSQNIHESQSKPFSRLLPSLFGSSDEVATVEKELKKENKELKQNLALLEKRYQALNEKKGFSESTSNGSIVDRASKAELYEKLCENLNLNEEDVNLLLQQGPFWPDCRATTNDCSIIDHLWMLTDQQSEHEEEKSSWEDEKSLLESQIRELKRIGGDNGEGWETLRSELKSLEEEQDRLRDEKVKGEAESKVLEIEGKKKDEVIKGLEQRITAYEEATPISNGHVPRSPAPSVAGGASVSAASTFAMKTLVKTISDLNEQLAAVRDENTSLLLKLVSTE